MNHQLHPLQINPKTGELFLPLRNHKNIILTPPRLNDAPDVIQNMNDEDLNQWMTGPPIPYLPVHATDWLEKITEISNATIQKLEAARDTPDLIKIDDCPVRTIRQVNEDGTDELIGDIGIQRCEYGELMGPDGVDWSQKEVREMENSRLPEGDPRIVFSLGDYMASSHHGQGIMTDAIGTLLHDWAVPRMNLRKIIVLILEGNLGSIRVFEKNGFVMEGLFKEHVSARGRVYNVHCMSLTISS